MVHFTLVKWKLRGVINPYFGLVQSISIISISFFECRFTFCFGIYNVHELLVVDSSRNTQCRSIHRSLVSFIWSLTITVKQRNIHLSKLFEFFSGYFDIYNFCVTQTSIICTTVLSITGASIFVFWTHYKSSPTSISYLSCVRVLIPTQVLFFGHDNFMLDMPEAPNSKIHLQVTFFRHRYSIFCVQFWLSNYGALVNVFFWNNGPILWTFDEFWDIWINPNVKSIKHFEFWS